MTRTVIRIEELRDLNGATRFLMRPEEPQNVTDRGRQRPLDCDPRVAPFTDLAAVSAGHVGPLPNDLVQLVGAQVFQALTAHPGVAQALDMAINTPPGTAHPIHVLTSALGAEALPWEAIHHPTALFLSLDRRWPIARVVDAGRNAAGRFFEPPLRITAVLAAADRLATGEWDALRTAVNATGMPVEVTVYVADDQLESHIGAQGDGWADVRYIPATEDGLVNEIETARPQLVHVFAHGSSQFGGFLEVATRGHQTMGDPPLFLAARHLSRLRSSAWLVTLNACEGAAPSAEVHSLAYSLVKEGVPAAIGMREVIDSRDASVFTGAFYGEALRALAGALQPGARVRIDWAEHLHVARAALCRRLAGPASVTAALQKPWTLPALYRRAEELWVRTANPALPIDIETQERISSMIEVYRVARDGLHPDTPQWSVDKLDDDIAELERQLR
jgi:hypothetical protein